MTKNKIAEQTRSLPVSFNLMLASILDLKMQVKQAHWNVQGAHFMALHKYFDEIASELEAHADIVAERVVQLGEIAHGTLQDVARSTHLSAYPNDTTDGMQHVGLLASAIRALCKRVETATEIAQAQADCVSEDICTQINRGLQKMLWVMTASQRA